MPRRSTKATIAADPVKAAAEDAKPGPLAQLLSDLRTPGRVRKLAVYVITITAALLASNLIPDTYRHYAEAVIGLGGFFGIYAARNDPASQNTADPQAGMSLPEFIVALVALFVLLVIGLAIASHIH